MSFTEILHKIVDKHDLTSKEASFALRQIIEGNCSDIEAGAFLFGMRAKGETILELTAFVQTMRDAMVKVEVNTEGAVDLCGTGGDHSGYFNISTAAMFVVAGAGVPVLKHGNRSVSSLTGSADVLDALGAKIDLSKEQVEKTFEKSGMAFMFAPLFHPAMKNIVPVRKALKMRTFFNILGPLLNPAGVQRQLIGTFNSEIAQKMADILAALKTERAITVHAHQGLDEVSVLSATDYVEVKQGLSLGKNVFNPKDLGLIYTDDTALKGGDKIKNSEIIQAILNGDRKGIAEDMVMINAAFAIQVSQNDLSIHDAILMARESLRSGKAKSALAKYVQVTHEV
jgi:anthranilate phosphoribosyltransferase